MFKKDLICLEGQDYDLLKKACSVSKQLVSQYEFYVYAMVYKDKNPYYLI